MAVTGEAIEKIKAMITSGALRAGDRLPREADLAAGLGLSRSSLREAVRALSLVNILDVRRGGPTTRARVWRGLTQTGPRSQTLAEHRAILDALAAHEPEVARSWATVHIAGVEQCLASVP